MARIKVMVAPWSAAAGEALLSAWTEYEQGTTPEARLVKDMDKVGLGFRV
jgi:5'-deoxynucleotidase YfbR-like HD superfamily hydrolase